MHLCSKANLQNIVLCVYSRKQFGVCLMLKSKLNNRNLCCLVFVQGKNDGAVKGVRYFRCRARHGVFVRHDKLVMDKKRNRRSVGRTSPMTSHSPSSASVRRSTSNLSAQTPTMSPGDVSVPSYMRSTYSSNAK